MATAPELDRPAADPTADFREEARAWIAAHFPASLKGAGNALAGIEGGAEPTADEESWRKAMGGRSAALETTCNEVGFRSN